ncbi:MAG: hypothetical protein HY691_08705 [Chloroflexi bacterium]|nr:hypothetical protein [Chloroflexota bacterium]
MQIYDLPDWLLDEAERFLFATNATRHQDSGKHLYGAGRALGWVRMAADALAVVPCADLKLAEYHTYAGVCAARTALDAIASWLRIWLLADRKGYEKADARSNLTHRTFRRDVMQALSGRVGDGFRQKLEALGNLGTKIDPHRQRAAHREGLALRPADSSCPGTCRWHLAPKGLQFGHGDDVDIVQLLREWADEIEAHLRDVLVATRGVSLANFVE